MLNNISMTISSDSTCKKGYHLQLAVSTHPRQIALRMTLMKRDGKKQQTNEFTKKYYLFHLSKYVRKRKSIKYV